MTSPTTHPEATGAGGRTEPPIDPRLLPWIAFIRAHAAVYRRLDAELETEQALSLPDYDALVQLALAEGRRLRMSELAERMVLTRSGVSRLVDRLAAEGFVERVACATDARGAFAALTDAGFQRLRAASPTHLRGIDVHFLAGIPAADRDAFLRVLDGIMIASTAACESGREDPPAT